MRTKSLLFLFLLVAQTITAQFRITGNLQNLDNRTVYFKYINDNLEEQEDSANTIDGSFTIAGTVNEPTVMRLYTEDGALDKQFLFDKGTTTITGDLNTSNYVISGSKYTDEMTAYQLMDAPYMLLRDSLAFASFMHRSSGDTVAANITRKKFEEVLLQSKADELNFLASHPNSPVSAYLIYWLYQHPGARAKGDSLLQQLTPANRQSKYARYRDKIIKQLSRLEPGNSVIDFAQADTSGKPVSTQLFKGRYYLIDFWASWCKPCREENPHVLKAYNIYHKKGFDVLAVSLDDNRSKWIAAIIKDAMPWIHVSDLKGWKNEAAKLYHIKGVPENFLIDKNGTIIAKSLRGDNLHKKLAELFE